MYEVSAQGVDERMLNVLLTSCTVTLSEPPTPKTLNRLAENETVACPDGKRKEGVRTLCGGVRIKKKNTNRWVAVVQMKGLEGQTENKQVTYFCEG